MSKCVSSLETDGAKIMGSTTAFSSGGQRLSDSIVMGQRKLLSCPQPPGRKDLHIRGRRCFVVPPRRGQPPLPLQKNVSDVKNAFQLG